MSPRARKVCAHPGCPNLQGDCPTHDRKAWDGSTRGARLPGSRQWERIRRHILQRDSICRACDNALSVEVDHVQPGDDHRPSNLQGLCVRCHREKTQTEAARARTT